MNKISVLKNCDALYKQLGSAYFAALNKLNVMKKIFTLLVLVLAVGTTNAQTYHSLASSPFSQNWTNIALITANDTWTNVPSIIGYRGDDVTIVTGGSPDTMLRPGTFVINVLANQTAVTSTGGGVGEFELTNPVVGLQGSGTGDAPHLIIYLNTTGRFSITFSCLLRDIDGSADNAVQPIAFQYRIGNTGEFTNIPGTLVADASSGPGLATLETAVSFILPAACNNKAEVQLRIITANATGSDEWIGIDDINVTQGSAVAPLNLKSFNASLLNKEASLAWSTSNEINVNGFEIERSNDGTSFNNVGFIAANNTARNNYLFIDVVSINSATYYRLKMIDKDGSFKYSPTVVLNGKASIKLDVSPNPVTNSVIVSHAKAGTNSAIKIVTVDGRNIITYNVQVSATQSNIDVSKLTKGNYLVVFENDGTRVSTQLVKQ